MPYDNFSQCYAYTAVHEGGKFDHLKDPGGRINLGVTQRVYDAWRKRRGLPQRDVWEIDPEEAREIFREDTGRPPAAPRCGRGWTTPFSTAP